LVEEVGDGVGVELAGRGFGGEDSLRSISPVSEMTEFVGD
jgi:hypothetical protein